MLNSEQAHDFWKKVSPIMDDRGCWEWTGGRSRKSQKGGGYGVLRVNGTPQYAHRYSYALHNGAIPSGLDVLHKCDNTTCVNPMHMFLGTQTDNDRDRDAKGRTAKGSQSGTAKLNDEAVREIRAILSLGRESQRSIARRFGVCQQTVSFILTRKVWRHL
jgi:hypothetical protein